MTQPRVPVLPSSSLSRVAGFVEEHHRGTIDVATLAEVAGYSRHHFSRAFKATCGINPGAYLTAARIGSAKRLLLDEDCAVIDVAVEVGFDSLSSFTRRFATTVGTTPARLRRLARGLEDAAPRPFEVALPGQPVVTVRPVLPDGVRDDCRIWLGWYPSPAPIGLPAAGVLRDYDEPLRVALHPAAPWLLGFVVEAGDDHLHQLAPRWPVVARHPGPITEPICLTLPFRRAVAHDIPLLSALPALAR